MTQYTPQTKKEVSAMLKKVGVKKINDLFSDIPENLKVNKLALAKGMSEADVEKELFGLSQKNASFKTVLRGAGCYDHYIPAAVRLMAARSEFVTAYTPYQAELSQGILQSIFEYQTEICYLTGMDVSNASHYDGATATAEAALMCKEKNRTKIVIAPHIKPDTLTVLKTYLAGSMEIVFAPEKEGFFDIEGAKAIIDDKTAAIILEQPSYIGLIEDAENIGKLAHDNGAKFIMSGYPISYGILKKPSECNADIAVGEGQSLGLNMNFGGAYLGYMAVTKAMQRKLPGRIVGETLDSKGNKAYVLTLQAREQHIRREKASSNICSNEAYCALTAAMFLAYLGENGLREVAEECVNGAHYLAEKLEVIGLKRKYPGEFFNEFVTICNIPSDVILDALAKKGILGGLKISDSEILWCVTEKVTAKEINFVTRIIKGVKEKC